MKQLIISVLVLSNVVALAQTVPSGAGGTNAGSGWWRGGNTQGNGANIMATTWNSPIYWYTDGYAGGSVYQASRARMKLHGTFDFFNQYSINGFDWNQGVNASGYLLLGFNNNSMADGQNIYSQKGAFSLLHLNGPGSVYQEFGYRPWMKTGITFTGNRDLSYFGLRKLSTNAEEEDITETVILWSDNNGSTEGPDHLVFRFSGHGGSDGGSVSSNRLSNTDLDGLHVATFTGLGFMGLGNTFGTNATGMAAANYINPQSILHTSYDFRLGAGFRGYGYHQITYRRDGTTTIGTGETANDGLRWGIDNNLFNTNGIEHLNAYIRWQENSPLIFQTDWDNTPGGTENGERIRIHSTAAPGVPAASMMPINTNVTRIAMSYFGNGPITQPRTLLHMGTNNGDVPGWMEYGAMTANATQAAFIGITPLNYTDPNQNVVGFWNANLVFIGGPGETGRFSNNSGYLGVGDFSPTGLAVEPQQRIDVEGNGRFRIVPADGGQSIILGITQDGDPDDIILSRLEFPNDPTVVLQGDGTWGPAGAQGPAGPQGDPGPQGPQGPPGEVNLRCSSGGEILVENSKIDMQNNNFYFEHNDEIDLNHVGVGYDCSSPLPGKLSVHQIHPGSVNQSTTAVHAINDDESAGDFGSTNTAVLGHSYGIPVDFDQYRVNRGGDFYAANSFMNNGVLVIATEGVNPNSVNEAGLFRAYGGSRAVGIQSVASSSTTDNIGVVAIGNNGQTAYGIFADANGAATNYAGYFVGNGVYTGSWTNISDSTLKENITQESDVLDQVMLLNPVNYKMRTSEYENLNLSEGLQHGFISQEVQQVFPELIQTIIHPAQYDSVGVEISPKQEFLGLNYNGFISLNTAAIIELNEKLIEQQATIEDLNTRLVTLENCLLGILPMLCQMNNTLVAPTPEALQQQMRSMIDVELKNELAIVLDQNVPNPFAETTVITYSIPAAVTRAQIHFYDASGNLIKTVEITERGDGQLNVFGQDLSSGLYTYTLVADGQLIATKKMMKQ